MVDAQYFVLEQTRFIRQLHEGATRTFAEKKLAIEQGLEPWVTSYSEDEEPAFLTEWIEAQDSLRVLGRMCLSMLSGCLHAYLQFRRKQFGEPSDATTVGQLKKAFKDGWPSGYRLYFTKHVGISFDQCPVRFELIEESVLARNNIQHPSSITELRPKYSECDLRKVSRPIFVDASVFTSGAKTGWSWMDAPEIVVDEVNLELALQEVEKLAKWLDDALYATGKIP